MALFMLMSVHRVTINGSHVSRKYLEFYFWGVLFLNKAYYDWVNKVKMATVLDHS